RGRWSQREGDLRGAVLTQRRIGILAVVLLAWLYSRAIVGNEALADIGALSFSGLATLAPAVLFAVWRPRTPPAAVLTGLLVAVLVWAWALPVPVLIEAFGGDPVWLREGFFGQRWMAPDALFGLDGWSRITRAVLLSLLAGTGLTVLLAVRLGATPDALPQGDLDRRALVEAAERFLSRERIDQLLREAPRSGAVPGALVQQVERELSAVLGAGSARFLLEAARRRVAGDFDAVAELVDEASQALRFNQRVLEAALENMTQGISVVDAELKLVAWNRRYAELFSYPDSLLHIGTPVAELVRHNVERGLGGDGEAEAEVSKRIAHMRAGTPYVAERRIADSVIEIRGNPMPGGGFVATFTDVTDFRRSERELKQIAETLEQRVVARTSELAGAKAEAERANRAKTRFLAAVSHDLAQPLNAAHLFTHALAQKVEGGPLQPAVGNIDGALSSAESLLAGLLDISRLDAGGLSPKVQDFALDDLLQHLAAEFRVVAEAKGLELRCVTTKTWVRSDPQLLRRVLQNFLANAVRYTNAGRILLGLRRRGDALSIQVLDTGPGIAESDRHLIFEEFRRLDRGGQGLGLGLAIAERIARLLDHSLGLRSSVGSGTGFSIDVPLAQAGEAKFDEVENEPAAPSSHVLVLDNDPEVLKAMQALLIGWQVDVAIASRVAEAMQAVNRRRPDLLLLDYRLDAGESGLDLRDRLLDAGIDIPWILVTADHGEDVRRAVAERGGMILHKPLKPLALKSAMARLLAQR
ncbi:MAG: NahK/ErcS family hybrid sensor histidine kinase/response regulator, partial [Lysobacteraceae bacterium]